MHDVQEAPVTAEWLNNTPILLIVSAGRVRKANIAHAIHIPERRFRARVREVLDVRPDLHQLYDTAAKEIPMSLAEQLVREIFDNHPSIRVEFKWLT